MGMASRSILIWTMRMFDLEATFETSTRSIQAWRSGVWFDGHSPTSSYLVDDLSFPFGL